MNLNSKDLNPDRNEPKKNDRMKSPPLSPVLEDISIEYINKCIHKLTSFNNRMAVMNRPYNVDTVINDIKNSKLPFPLSRFYMTEAMVKQCYKNLKTYKPLWIIGHSGTLKGHPGKMYLPACYYDGQETHLMFGHAEWFKYNVIVDYFTEYERLRARKNYKKGSILDAWSNRESMETAIKYCNNNNKLVTGQNLRDGLYYGNKELSVFKVTKAKSMIHRILGDNVEGKRWLDMSAGWGDRLITACSLKMDYVGFDPNKQLKFGHDEIITMFGESDINERPLNLSIEYVPFETVDTSRYEPFDISLISPPFYTIERYNGDNQSTDVYPEFNDWMVKFLFKSLYSIWAALKDGGILAINIANIENLDIVTPMQLFIEEYLVASNWLGILTFSNEKHTAEPGIIYVWQKKLSTVKDSDGVITEERIIWNPSYTRSLKALSPAINVLLMNQMKSWPMVRLTDNDNADEAPKTAQSDNTNVATSKWKRRNT